MKLIKVIILSIFVSNLSIAAFEQFSFNDEVEKERYYALTEKIRCMVCQNQSLADSNADLASDLRQVVFTMIIKGNSDQEIIDFLLQRYGDFVLYQPPIKANTIFLWIAPFGFLLFALTFIVILSKRKKQ